MSASNHAAHGERPERSRNAKAQARHRAKRKAYIEQLEQTVTKLQLSAGYSQDQINAMPPPLLKIRELELENGRLQKENDELRRLLTDSTSQARFTSDTALRRPSLSTYADFRGPDRDYKRRRPGHQEDLYISPSDTPPHGHDPVSRVPPQLAIPQPHYGNINSNSTSHHNQSAQLFSLPNPGFQMPNTPSGSSATSSPPFSPVQIQPPLQSTIDHRPQISDHHSLSSNYPHSTGHYNSVKVEEDHYISTHQNTIHYSYTNGHNHNQNGLDWQTSYSSERGHLQR